MKRAIFGRLINSYNFINSFLTYKGKIIASIAGFCLIFSVDIVNNKSFYLGGLLLGALIASYTYLFFINVSVQITRILPSYFFAGTKNYFLIKVTNKLMEQLTNFTLEEKAVQSDNLIITQPLEGQKSFLKKGENETIKFALEHLERGELIFHSTVVKELEPLGLMWKRKQINKTQRVLVAPKFAKTNFSVPLNTISGSTFIFNSEKTSFKLFSGLKEYAPGDALKHAYWKSLPRNRFLTIKTYDKKKAKKWGDYFILVDNCAQRQSERTLNSIASMTATLVRYLCQGGSNSIKLISLTEKVTLTEPTRNFEAALKFLAKVKLTKERRTLLNGLGNNLQPNDFIVYITANNIFTEMDPFNLEFDLKERYYNLFVGVDSNFKKKPLNRNAKSLFFDQEKIIDGSLLVKYQEGEK